MSFREKIIRQFAFISLLVSVVLTALVFNQSDDPEPTEEDNA